jgi:rubredoxin---NAD+ reductase
MASTASAADAVLAVNDLADYAVLSQRHRRQESASPCSVADLIGCEFANDLAHAGFAVDVVHLGEWPLERLLPVEAGHRLANSLAALGVNWHFGRMRQKASSGRRAATV